MSKISHLDQLDFNQSYSYVDYLTWFELLSLTKDPETHIEPLLLQNIQKHSHFRCCKNDCFIV